MSAPMTINNIDADTTPGDADLHVHANGAACDACTC